ncbi:MULTISPECIES: NO-inducible flavohemoprotein [unclassified Halomonas]|uniref:NO-inducible flavohemoprotein n=1 Tax=unclassified Halomonas TaxID=2609666 RepID=UPI001C98061A|nr:MULTISPECIES: NO-inducible flavohemoprotein [unclassified Halomonas]MBY5926602.1 NO-inducible flavohemoprotein [Halomonas sp. DP4Y7-2]MBY6233685.1 NO-inducible flavohemoprotein [Halomonas sp. DP4Y7-1]
MTTAAQDAIIDATAPLVAEHLDAITARFYPLMFERYPEVKAVFNQAHQADGGQPKALARGVLAYVGLRQQPEAVRQQMQSVISKHVSLGIQPEQYPIVGECLMAAIGDVLGDAVTAEIADAWGALYGDLAELLIAAEAERYQAFAGRPGGWQGLREFRIAHIQRECEVIRSFILAPCDGQPVADALPGQYIGLQLRIDGETVHRHYSLSGSPNGCDYRISVKQEPGGRVSNYLHQQMQVGDTLALLPPAGELTLDNSDRPVMLISGGVGQTPMLPLARQALSQGRRLCYVHAARDIHHHAFRSEVDALVREYPTLMTRICAYDHGDDGDITGRLEQALLARLLPGADTQCYFVGPEPFMSAIDSHLAALGIAPEQRHYEHFGPSRPLHAA